MNLFWQVEGKTVLKFLTASLLLTLQNAECYLNET